MSGPQPLNAVGKGTEMMGMWESGEKLDVSERIKRMTKKYKLKKGGWNPATPVSKT